MYARVNRVPSKSSKINHKDLFIFLFNLVCIF